MAIIPVLYDVHKFTIFWELVLCIDFVLVFPTDSDNSSRVTPAVVTEETLSQYTIHDVLLPLPGFDVLYPENKGTIKALTITQPKWSIILSQNS